MHILGGGRWHGWCPKGRSGHESRISTWKQTSKWEWTGKRVSLNLLVLLHCSGSSVLGSRNGIRRAGVTCGHIRVTANIGMRGHPVDN